MKTKSIILIAISLGFGLVAAIGMTQVMGRQKAQVASNVEKEIDVLVAKRDIAISEVLTAEDVVSKRFRPSQVPEGVALTVEEITDMRATSRVGTGNFISKKHLIEKTKHTSIEIPKGYSVYSVRPSIESTFLNSLRAGDRIDIIGIVRKPKGNQQVAKTFLKNIRVFGINDQLSRRMSDEEKVSIKLVQVLLRPRQAEQLALVQSVGKIQFVMRPDDHSAVELDPDELADEGDTGPANLDEFFRDGTAVDPSSNGTLNALQLAAAEAARRNGLYEEEPEPIYTTFIGPDGPVQYVFASRSSLPKRVESGGILDDESMSGGDQPPTTYPPAGQLSPEASSVSPAGQRGSSSSSESSTNREQPESE